MNTQLSIIQTQSSFFVPTLQTFSNMIVENANDGVEISMVDVETVENIDNALVAAHGLSRSCLYWMREKKGYLILGFESFEKYGEARFGFSRQHLNRLADAHAIQNVIEPIGSKEIKESVLRQLGQVPDDVKKQIWNDAKAEADAENKKVTAKMIEDAVAKYKSDNAVLQKELVRVCDKLASVETIDIESIVNAEVQKVETEMQARFDAVQDKLSKAINDNAKIEQRIKNGELVDPKEIQDSIENLQQLRDQNKALVAELNRPPDQKNNARSVNDTISERCYALREAVGITFAELAGVRDVAKDLYEETNAQIHGTAEMLEEFAQQLRNFATDNAEFSMITA